MIKLICDTMSDVPKEVIEKYDIHVVPTTIIIDGKEYLDRVEMSPEEVYNVLRSSDELPKTSQATYAQFKEVFDTYANKYDEILYIGGSSVASGTYQSAVMASRDIEGSSKITTFDTYNFSAGGGVFVVKACQLVAEGKSASEVVQILESLKGTQRVFLSLGTLDYLYKGGRVSGVKAKLGKILNIKPILALEDGLIAPKSQVRGKKQMVSTIFNKSIEGIDDLENRIIVYGCGDNLDDGELLKQKILETNCKNTYEVKAGTCISAHSGPEIVGMAVL
ncbi:DegV family protein [Romboutsia sp.]|uniref:DegV family protein n=1 Tax=Romboutsia sp. TaxID=1965302 RepID=UPI003F404810